jgi:6-phosphogluconate dehydrogenase
VPRGLFMVGGDRDAYALLEPFLDDLAFDERRTLFVGGPASGHFAKLVHNAIEFGMVQTIAEGIELLATRSSRRTPAALFGNWGPRLGYPVVVGRADARRAT